jgi:ribose transport system substrate-binding protein
MQRTTKLVGTIVSGLALAAAVSACGTSGSSNGSTSTSQSKHKYVIALSNSFYANTWRHQMVNAFTQAAQQAKSQGLISNYIVENADNTVQQQTSQINDLILQHVDAIVIDAASPTALNGVIKKAEQAGIKVITFDSVVTEPNAYKLAFNFNKIGTDTGNYVTKRLNGKGNVLMVRGVAGSLPDQQMYQGMDNVIKKYPGIKVVGTVYGQGSASITESQVASILPSLPKIDAVMCQASSDNWGVVQAFQAAHKPVPPIVTGMGDAEFIKWWIGQNGWSTFTESTAPGIGGAAFWLSLDILNGAKAPINMTLPNAIVDKSNVMNYKDMKPGTIVSPTYTNAWVEKNVLHESK